MDGTKKSELEISTFFHLVDFPSWLLLLLLPSLPLAKSEEKKKKKERRERERSGAGCGREKARGCNAVALQNDDGENATGIVL